MLLKDLTWY